jgi:hypothetical protein
MAVNLKAKRGVIGYGWKKGGDSLATERLTLCDLQNGCMVRMVSGKFGELAPVALNDGGRHVLMRRNEHGGGNADRLEMWSIHKKKVVRTFVWTPFGDDPGWGHDVGWAEFINSQMLALSSTGGKLAIWDLKLCQNRPAAAVAIENHVAELRRVRQLGHRQVPDQIVGQLPPSARHLLANVAGVDHGGLARRNRPPQGMGDRATGGRTCPKRLRKPRGSTKRRR